MTNCRLALFESLSKKVGGRISALGTVKTSHLRVNFRALKREPLVVELTHIMRGKKDRSDGKERERRILWKKYSSRARARIHVDHRRPQSFCPACALKGAKRGKSSLSLLPFSLFLSVSARWPAKASFIRTRAYTRGSFARSKDSFYFPLNSLFRLCPRERACDTR